MRGAARLVADALATSVRDVNPEHVVANVQGELFPAWRYHGVFTDSPLTMLQADHRRHAIIEQVIADLKAGPLAHLPSGRFTANAAWLVLAAMAFNLTRGRRRAGLPVSCPSDHGHDPTPADQRASPPRALHPTNPAAPTHPLALG